MELCSMLTGLEAQATGLHRPDLPRPSPHGRSQHGSSRHPRACGNTISGHKTRSIFDRYNIVSKSDLHEAAKKLALRDQEREAAQANQDAFSYSSDTVGPVGGSVAPAAKLN
jgi:hypothetical protein